jgi:DNA-binding transcriptional LysR family regulator
MELSEQGGKLIFSKVEQALALFSEAETIISQTQNSATGVIRIGASETIFEYFLSDKIAEFYEKYPAVKIELRSDVTPNTVAQLKANHIDVGFVNLPIDENDAELKLYGNRMRISDTFVAGGKLKDLANGTISLSLLEKYPIITLEKNTVARRSLENFFQSIGLTLQPAIEVGSWDMMKRFVSRGMGLGVIPKEYAEKEILDGSLVPLVTDPVLPVRSVGVLLLKNSPVSFAVRTFLEACGLRI